MSVLSGAPCSPSDSPGSCCGRVLFFLTTVDLNPGVDFPKRETPGLKSTLGCQKHGTLCCGLPLAFVPSPGLSLGLSLSLSLNLWISLAVSFSGTFAVSRSGSPPTMRGGGGDRVAPCSKGFSHRMCSRMDSHRRIFVKKLCIMVARESSSDS